jgi:hypothetical protein
MMEAVCTSETSVDNHFTRQYNPEDSSEHPTYTIDCVYSNYEKLRKICMENEISGSHGGKHEDDGLMGYCTM